MDIKVKKLSIRKLLNNAIREVLYSGSTDPGYAKLEAASAMYVTLKTLNLKVTDEKGLLITLRGHNIYDEDFLKDFILQTPID